MKVTFNEENYEFKHFYSKGNGHELHLFKNDKCIDIFPLQGSEPSDFNYYIKCIKKHIKE